MLERDVAAIPDLVFKIDFLVADPPVIGARLLFDCTPQGELFGLAVNGRRVAFTENVFYRFAAGKIESVWSVIDQAVDPGADCSVEHSMASLKTIRTESLEIAFLDEGHGSGWPVVLSHGFPYDVHAFDDVVPHLTRAGARVIVPYLRGFGPTRFLSAGTMRSGQQAALGRDLIGLLDALDIKRQSLPATTGAASRPASRPPSGRNAWPASSPMLVMTSSTSSGFDMLSHRPLKRSSGTRTCSSWNADASA